jgi:hypothetical protein
MHQRCRNPDNWPINSGGVESSETDHGFPALRDDALGGLSQPIVRGGHLVTSSLVESGLARDEYYYSGNAGLKALSQAHDTGMVWNKFNDRFGGAATQTEFFFIGTSADYQKYGSRHDTPPMHGPIKR